MRPTCLDRGAGHIRKAVHFASTQMPEPAIPNEPTSAASSVARLRVGAIEYLVGSSMIQAVVVGGADGSKAFSLCKADDCLMQAHQLLDALDGPSTPKERARQLEAFSAGWGPKLLPPPDALAEFDVLVLIPHHTLHALPLHAIKPANGQAPLALTHGVTYCSSATLFSRCVERNTARNVDCDAWIPGTNGTAPLGGPPLPRLCAGIAADAWDGKDEMYKDFGRLMASYFPESRGPETIRFAIKRPIGLNGKQVTTYDVIYFVTHGYYDHIHPLNSGLLVENPNAEILHRALPLPGGRYAHYRDLPFRDLPKEIAPRDDASAEMMTIGELQIEGFTHAQLVALLGCSTNAGHILSGDGVESIAYQWLRLGAASALANLWRLDIDFISAWMNAFLDGWLRLRQPKAIAWREAMRKTIAVDSPPPMYQWAGLQLMGDWV